MRVMHISRGFPLISAEHEPHFPALQFQRTARSGACSAWMACTASSTTIPSPAATRYSFSSPRSRVPRNSRSVRCSDTLFPFLNEGHQIRWNRRLGLAPDDHAVPFFLNGDLFPSLPLVGVGIVAACMRTATFGALQRRPGAGLGDHEERAQVDRRVPARIVLAAARHPNLAGAGLELLELGQRVLQTALVSDDAGVSLHDCLYCRLHGKGILTLTPER